MFEEFKHLDIKTQDNIIKNLVFAVLKNTFFAIDKPWKVLNVSSKLREKDKKKVITYLEELKSWAEKKDNIWFLAWEEFTGYHRRVIRKAFLNKIKKKLINLKKVD